MKKGIQFFLGATVLIFSGCGTVQQAQINSAASEAQTEIAQICPPLLRVSEKEARVWASGPEIMKNCINGIQEPWPRDERTQKVMTCITDYMNNELRPVSYSSKSFDQYMRDRAINQKAYLNGDITWQEFSQKAQERRQKYLEGGNKGSYFAFANCQTSILRQKVGPVYPAQLQPALANLISDLLAFSRQADKDKLPEEDYQVGVQKLWSEFTANEQQVIAHHNAQNAQAWQNFSERLQQINQQQAAQNQSTFSSAPCVYNPANNSYQQCHHFTAGGQCAHYGDVCRP